MQKDDAKPWCLEKDGTTRALVRRGGGNLTIAPVRDIGAKLCNEATGGQMTYHSLFFGWSHSLVHNLAAFQQNTVKRFSKMPKQNIPPSN